MKPMIDVFPVFIGWDSREIEAAEVTKSSLIKHASIPIHIQFLKERALRHAGLYNRRWRAEGDQKFDVIDGKPFSTEFSFDRFLIPALMQWDGWALFCDCDWLFRADLARLVEELDDKYAVMVCKQNYKPKTDVKMDGQKQEKYFRKNWSSFIAFNCGHPTNKFLTVQTVNEEPGNWLHGLGWVPDNEIGNLDHRWNWIDGTTEGEPLAVHLTEGGPWFKHLEGANKPYFDEWKAEATRIGVWETEAA
jgi:hypothetical protein